MANISTLAVSASDKRAALALTPVSRETEQRLDRYVALLAEWQAKTNLIAPSTLPHLWTRHVSESSPTTSFDKRTFYHSLRITP